MAIDCRDFHDPDRDRQRGPNRLNHIGYHHTVFRGILRHGANVYSAAQKRKVGQTLKEWWTQNVLTPLWSSCQRLAGSAAGRSTCPVPPKVIVVFFCKWGRHRSVCLQNCLVRSMPALHWAELIESSHLASHSWSFATCNFCQVPRFLQGTVSFCLLKCRQRRIFRQTCAMTNNNSPMTATVCTNA